MQKQLNDSLRLKLVTLLNEKEEGLIYHDDVMWRGTSLLFQELNLPLSESIQIDIAVFRGYARIMRISDSDKFS